jgi:hypothetical protein
MERKTARVPLEAAVIQQCADRVFEVADDFLVYGLEKRTRTNAAPVGHQAVVLTISITER